MHYRNGREAKNGDKIVQIGNGGGLTTWVFCMMPYRATISAMAVLLRS